jgi:hypothetical protein
LIWLFALAAQPAPKAEHFVELGNERYMPEELRDRPTEDWLGPPELCRELMVALFEGMLADLREREQVLRVQFEDPSRLGAEVREQVLRGPDGAQVARLERMHRQNFVQAYQTFLKGRKESLKTEVAPGMSRGDVEGADAEQFVRHPMSAEAKAASRRAQGEEKKERSQQAGRVRPGAKSGIGALRFDGDELIAGVRAHQKRQAGAVGESATQEDAESPERHSHAERGNERGTDPGFIYSNVTIVTNITKENIDGGT